MKLKSLLLLTTGAALAAPAVIAQDMADRMTVVSWGGAYQTSQINAYTVPYSEMNPDVEITWDESSPEAVARLRAMDEADNLTWDLVDVVAADAIRLCDEGLAMEIDHDAILAEGDDGTPATEDFGDLIVSDCFIPQIVYSTTNGYRTDVAEWEGRTPEDVCALFDLENFPGTRMLERRPINNMEWALLCDGVAMEDIYDVLETPEGIDRAFAKLDTIKEDTLWWTSAAEAVQYLADGEAVIGSTYNGRLFSAIVEQDQPIEMLWDAQVFDIDGWIIPEGLSDEALARVEDFLYFATDTQRLADQAQYISYGPARATSAPMVSTHAELGVEMGPHMPTSPENSERVIVFNYLWWADYRDDLDARFQSWLSQ